MFNHAYIYRRDALRAIRRKGLDPQDFKIERDDTHAKFSIVKRNPIVPEIKLSDLKAILTAKIEEAFSVQRKVLQYQNNQEELLRLNEREWDFSDAWDNAKNPRELIDLMSTWFNVQI